MTLTTPAALAAEFHARAAAVEPQVNMATRMTLADINADYKTFITELGAVDTGFLRASGSWEMTGATEGQVGPEAHYGIFVEEGTFRMPPRPALEMATRRRVPAYEEVLADIGGWDVDVSRGFGSFSPDEISAQNAARASL